MSIKTIEYCSLHYLNQWLEHDRHFHQALTMGDEKEKLKALKEAANFYVVARTLPRVFDEDKKNKIPRYQPILEILEKVNKSQLQINPVDGILEIERKISDKYGGRSVLSPTTKFLWLKVKQPIIIYDSRARKALGVNDSNLSDYYKKWKNEFTKYEELIRDICLKLPDLYLYSADQKIGTKEYIKDISTKSWFHERVFDIYLWSK